MLRNMIDGNSSIQGNSTSGGFNSKKSEAELQRCQEIIYKFLVQIVQEWSPDKGILEFQHLYFSLESSNLNLEAVRALTEIVMNNNEAIFRETLKRSCYILINNWETTRNYIYIKELVTSLEDINNLKDALSRPLSRTRHWIKDFVVSQEYQELKLFTSRHDEAENKHWSSRYTSFLLVPQYTDANNPIEQREAAQALSQQLKSRFKFDLAMYTARSGSITPKQEAPQNPTALGDGVLRLVKKIVIQINSHKQYNVSRLFLKQVENLPYDRFKLALQRYLIYSVDRDTSLLAFNDKLSAKLETLLADKNDEIIDNALLLRTCNRLIDYLTTETRQEPSSLFILFLSQGSTITLVIILLKIVSISPNSRVHLEERVAKLIHYYMGQSIEDSAWIINFFEIFKITSAIYTDSVEYNLVKIRQDGVESLDGYRLFSQLKDNEEKRDTELSDKSSAEQGETWGLED